MTKTQVHIKNDIIIIYSNNSLMFDCKFFTTLYVESGPYSQPICLRYVKSIMEMIKHVVLVNKM